MPSDREPGIRAGVKRLFSLEHDTPAAASRAAGAELDSLVEERVEYLMARGLSESDARAEAVRRLGASSIDAAQKTLASSARERERVLGARERLASVIADLRYAARALRLRPGFSLGVVLTLTLGIGAATAVFGVVNGVLLRALPYPQPEQLVRIYETAPPAQGSALRSLAIPTLADWRANAPAFSGIAFYGTESFDLAGDGPPERVSGASVSAAFFPILGARAAVGRVFTEAEEQPGVATGAVLSHRLWQRRFGADSSIVGRTIRIDRESFTVLGVMPAGFSYPQGADLWLPIGTDHEYDAREARHVAAIGRMKPGVSIGTAEAQLLSEERRLAAVYPKIYANRGVKVFGLSDRITGAVRPVLRILSIAVALVLLVACANVANLLLARSTTRRREIATRTALGGSRARITRQLFAETAILFAIAGALGVALAAVITRFVQLLPPSILPRAGDVHVDLRVAVFALVTTAFTALVFGMGPSIRATGVMPNELLADDGRGASSRRSGRARSGLIMVETALAAVLLVGAGLLLRSLRELQQVDPGFDTARVLAFEITAPPEIVNDVEARITFFRDLRERLEKLPGVRGVGLASRLPLSGDDHSNSFRLDDDAGAAMERNAQDRSISPGFFSALGIRVLEGREFTAADGATASQVAMVNQAFATRYFPGQSAIGKRFTPSRAGSVPRTIVGVVRDTRQFGPQTPPEPEFYIPHAQDPWQFMRVALRAEGNPFALVPGVRRVVAEMDPDQPIANLRTIDEMVSAIGAQRTLIARTLSMFALVAYALAAIGMYGIIAYAVAERTREIGVRMALGARVGHIGRLVVMRAVSLAAAGGIAGLILAVPLTRLIQGMLFGVTANDPTTFILVGVLIPTVALAASLIPLRRALRIEPVTAMRG